MENRFRVLAVDLDGFLCKGDAWTPEEVLKAKPIEENIKMSNELYKENFLVIYTARRDFLIPATLEWLRRNNVMWCAVSNKKMPAHEYFDDRCNIQLWN